MPTRRQVNKGRLWVYFPPESRKKLAKLIITEGTTYREVAAAAGYNGHAMIVHLIKGRKNGVSLEVAVKMSEFLGVSVFDLFVPKTSQETEQLAALGKTPPQPKKVAA